MTLSGRRWRAVSLTVLVGAGLVMLFLALSRSMRDTAFLSGWMLFGLLLFLAAYNLRKKLPYPPLLSSSTWLQFHIYLGFLSILLFLIHAGVTLPEGPLNMTLAGLFVVVSGSGVVGLVLSRTTPLRLTASGQEVLFERIPLYRRQLREEAEDLVVRCAEQARTTTLADFYQTRLVLFFEGPRHFWLHQIQGRRPLLKLLQELRALERYLNDEERQAAARLAELIEAKDSLDYQHTRQGVLKGWLFVHIPLTYALLLFVVVHAVLAHAFSMALR